MVKQACLETRSRERPARTKHEPQPRGSRALGEDRNGKDPPCVRQAATAYTLTSNNADTDGADTEANPLCSLTSSALIVACDLIVWSAY